MAKDAFVKYLLHSFVVLTATSEEHARSLGVAFLESVQPSVESILEGAIRTTVTDVLCVSPAGLDPAQSETDFDVHYELHGRHSLAEGGESDEETTNAFIRARLSALEVLLGSGLEDDTYVR